MQKSLIKKTLILATLLPLTANSQNESAYQPPFFTDNNRLAKIQRIFPLIDKEYKAHAKKHHFPGYAYGIIVDGQLVHSGSGGYIDVKEKIPVTSHSMFRVASMTKSFTAMAILKLRDEGKLKLDDPVYFYIPEMKNQKLTQDSPVITIRDLLTHSAGFPQDDPWGDRRLNTNDEELIAFIKKGVSFSNASGTTYEYSNLAFSMLGYIIKKVSGVPYQEFIATHIWQPLDMKEATWEFSNISASQLARGYKWINNSWQEEEMLHDGTFGSMGGMIASIDSFSRYIALHQLAWPARDDIEKGPIKRSSIREMHQPWRFNALTISDKYTDNPKCNVVSAYGYGMDWIRDCEGKVAVGHNGGLPGFGSNWLIMPDYGIGVVFFANTTYAPSAKINFNVLQTLVKEAQLSPRQLPPSHILQIRQQALIKLLPNWNNAEASGIFAENFFLDNSVATLKKETEKLFVKSGQIMSVEKIIPQNQLRGSFIIKGKKADLLASFTLSPENPALIQKFKIEQVE
jgi:CubicO group peptidase (beta-lactamase class C family)